MYSSAHFSGGFPCRRVVMESLLKSVRKSTSPGSLVSTLDAGSGPAGESPLPTEASMEGTLDEIPVPEVVQNFTASGKSGVLHLSRGSTPTRIYFKDGASVFARPDDTEERLGERLGRAGGPQRSEPGLASRA